MSAFRSAVFGTMVLGAVLGAVACGSDPSGSIGGGGPPGGMIEFDAGQIGNGGSAAGGSGGVTTGGTGGGIGGSGGSGGAGAAGGSGGSGGTPPSYTSNTPNANVTTNAPGATVDLFLLSSNVRDKPSGSQYFAEWTGLIQNVGSAILCYPQVTAEFYDGAIKVADHYTFADTPPYDSGSSTLSSPCLGPGEIGGLYSNGFTTSSLVASGIDSITFTFDADIYPGTVKHPLTPTVSGMTLTEPLGSGTGYWAVSGNLTATGTIYNIGLYTYPVGFDQLVPARPSDIHLETLISGSSWQFETSTYQGIKASSTIHAYPDFIEGSALIVTPDFDVHRPDDGDLLAKARTALGPDEKARVQRQLRLRRTARATSASSVE